MLLAERACDGARLAALALAIWSRKAADELLYARPGSVESDVIPVLADATEGLEALVPSYEATDDPRETNDAFLGVSAAAVFFSAGADGFFNKPTDGRLLKGLGARVLEADLGTGISGTRFSGLGLRDRGTETVLGGGIPYMDVRGCLADVVFAEDVWNDWMLFLLRSGVS